MSSIAKVALSGSTNGMPIKVHNTATLGTVIHTAPSGTTSYDEIWAWVHNTSVSSVNLTLEFGDATAPDHNIVMSVNAQSGLYLIVPGLLLQNSLVFTAFAGTADVLTIVGFVNRITL